MESIQAAHARMVDLWNAHDLEHYSPVLPSEGSSVFLV
jgi:hypothetical protein